MSSLFMFLINIILSAILAAISNEWLSEYLEFTINASFMIGAVVVPAIFIFVLYKFNDTVAVSEDGGSLYTKFLTLSTIFSLVVSVIIYWVTEEDINKITFGFSGTFSTFFAIAWYNTLAYFGRKISINLQHYSNHGTIWKKM